MTQPLVNPWLAAAAALVCCLPAQAQERIYRCGNEYTNNANQAKERGCKLVEGGNITVVEGVRSAPASGAGAAPKQSTSPPSAPAPPEKGPELPEGRSGKEGREAGPGRGSPGPEQQAEGKSPAAHTSLLRVTLICNNNSDGSQPNPESSHV